MGDEPGDRTRRSVRARPSARGEDPRRRLGAEGEARAAAYLEARGYRIVAANARADGVEIDLIARKGGLLVFAEVKTRRSRSAGLPEEAVDGRKRARLVRGARAWLASSSDGAPFT